jgi:hypothetical protein
MRFSSFIQSVAAPALLVSAPRAARAQAATEPEEWEIVITPYVWFSGVEGTIGARDRTAPVDSSFSEILSNLRVAGMVNVQARKGKLTLGLDLNYTSVEDSSDLPSNLFRQGKVRTKTFVLSPTVGWRVAGDQTAYADVFAGFRVWSIENRITLSGGVAPETNVSQRQTWFDPIIGGSLRTPLTPKLSAGLLGDIGGFGAGSRFTWQLVGTLHYEVGGGNSVVLGYRHKDVNYRRKGVIYDVAQSGPVLGFSFGL